MDDTGTINDTGQGNPAVPAPAGHGGNGPPQGPPGDTAPPLRTHVEKHDVWLLLGVTLVSLAILGAFFWYVFHRSSLLTFPFSNTETTPDTYFTDALEYRERRAALALMLRSFTTGFAFVVGLALAMMGGIFILRQVTALTKLDMGPGSAVAEGQTPDTLRNWLKATQFSFQSYSPGVVFMLGGLGVIGITQMTALPVITPEIGPNGALQCWNERFRTYLTCGLETLQDRLEYQKQIMGMEKEIADLARAAQAAGQAVGTATPQGDNCTDPLNKELCQ